jgi:hypothetical protein
MKYISNLLRWLGEKAQGADQDHENIHYLNYGGPENMRRPMNESPRDSYNSFNDGDLVSITNEELSLTNPDG